MKTRIAVGGALASAAVIIGAWQTGQTTSTRPASSQAAALPADDDGTAATGNDPTTTAPSTAPTATPAPSSDTAAPGATAGTLQDGTFTGTTVTTRYGDVQVSVTVTSGAITAVTALHLTDDDGRSVQISQRAAPVLEQEVLAAQSAQVDTVSGATYTSDAYLQSLQAALDQAG